MPNFAAVLKEEIARIARKEARQESAGPKKATVTHRSEIAALKRRVQALEKALRKVQPSRRSAAAALTADSPAGNLRFSAKGLAAQRKRLGISADACGKLLGVSGQSIYLWESGRARPSAKHLEGVAALRKLGRRAVAERLESLG
jgi:DNA-binding transcriptional regulator YiaG